MKSIEYYEPAFVSTFPLPMERGVLYISSEYSTAGHICPCGCGSEVVTKLSPARYKVIYDGEISLKPSVASTGLPCNSHYFITRGEVDWQQKLTATQAIRVRESDRDAIEDQRNSNHQNAIQRIFGMVIKLFKRQK